MASLFLVIRKYIFEVNETMIDDGFVQLSCLMLFQVNIHIKIVPNLIRFLDFFFPMWVYVFIFYFLIIPTKFRYETTQTMSFFSLL